MSVISSISVNICSPLPPEIKSCIINRSIKDYSDDVYSLFLEGQVVATESNANRIDFYCEDVKFDRAIIGKNQDRSISGTIPDNEKGRFEASLNLIELPAEAQVEIYAVVGPELKKYLVATIDINRKPLSHSYKAIRTPIILTSMGRSGTTWFMRLLREHPDVYVHEEYPYEMLIIQYYTNMLVALSSPLSGDRLLDKWHLRDFQKRNVSPNIFYRNDVLDAGTITHFGNDHISDLADFCLQSIDKAYDRLIENYARSNKIQGYNPVYFSEKGLVYRSLIKELYPDAKQIFLLRDVRDNISSALAFNEKRGTQEFGRAAADSDEDFIENRCSIFNQRYNEYNKYRETSHLIRYEDLIEDPKLQIENALAYLGLDNRKDIVEDMFLKATESSDKMSSHRTSSETQRSVQRWREDLPKMHQDLSWQFAGKALADLGYPKD